MLGVPRIHARKVAEDTVPRFRRQHGTDEVFLLDESLFVDEEEEKRFVLLDRTAEPRPKLIAIDPIQRGVIKIVEPV